MDNSPGSENIKEFKSRQFSEQEIKDLNGMYYEKFSANSFEEKDVVKVFLAEPSGGQVDIICEDNRKDLFFELGKLQSISKFRFFSGSTGRMHVSYARETFAEEALRLGMDWILFFDDDQVLPKNMFLSLARHMEKADIIAPLIIQRMHPYLPVYYKFISEDHNGKNWLSSEHIKDYPVNGIFNPDGVGFGVVLIRTELFAKMPKPWFFSNTALGEDLYFCFRAKQLGFRLIADTRIKVGHLATPRIVTELDYINTHKETLKERHKDKLAYDASKSKTI